MQIPDHDPPSAPRAAGSIGLGSGPAAPGRTPTVAEVDGFIDLLRAACDNPSIHHTLEKLLSQPDERRQALVHNWVSDLLLQGAPKDFARAIACLLDDGVAEKAYEVIFQCQRGSLLERVFRRSRATG